jgi:ubiquinone/menaquinone biosynthesis C-methylase UbiE
MTDDRLKQVEEFWNKNLCGKHFISAQYPSKEFFEQYQNFRYKKEHHLNCLIDWKSAINKDVLEIGLGVGADGTRWAKYAKSYTGIDLTEESVQAITMNLRIKGLKGNILKSNVESLPFEDNKFDLVYSHGVLHHVSDIMKALGEIHRVLKDNGEMILMLYSKDSVNYWLRIQLYFRLRFPIELIKSRFGVSVRDPWKSHIRNFHNVGWKYVSWSQWYHHCTDGPDCEIANIYHKAEIIKIFKKAGFHIRKMRKAHFPITKGRYQKFDRLLAKYIGFYQFIWANKV